MRIKKVIGLEFEEQQLINEFADLIRFICDQVDEDCSACYFKPLCPHRSEAVDSFCELWSEREYIEVEKDE